MAAATKLLTSGGGGLILTPASSIASDVTVNIPAQNCTLGIQGPAFSAYQSSAQTISSNTSTKIQFQTKEFDTSNAFDSTTNYRFTPPVAGYYQVNGNVTVSTTTTNMYVDIFKNGTNFKQGTQPNAAGGSGVNAVVYLNGSTDYIELYAFIVVGQALAATAAYTYFQAVLVRSA